MGRYTAAIIGLFVSTICIIGCIAHDNQGLLQEKHLNDDNENHIWHHKKIPPIIIIRHLEDVQGSANTNEALQDTDQMNEYSTANIMDTSDLESMYMDVGTNVDDADSDFSDDTDEDDEGVDAGEFDEDEETSVQEVENDQDVGKPFHGGPRCRPGSRLWPQCRWCNPRSYNWPRCKWCNPRSRSWPWCRYKL